MMSAQYILIILLTSTLHAVHPLHQSAAFAIRVAARQTAQSARVARTASQLKPKTRHPHIARAALYSEKNETPSLEECAKKLPALLAQKNSLESNWRSMDKKLWRKLVVANQEEIERYRKPILDHLQKKRNDLPQTSDTQLQRETLASMEVRLETESYYLKLLLDELIK